MTHALKSCDPNTYADDKGQSEWDQSMSIEMYSLLKNNTWDLVPRSQGKNVVKCR